MPQIANLGVRIQYQFTVIDDHGNTHALPSEPIQIQEPSEAAFLAAWRRWEAERDQHRARLAEAQEQAVSAAPGRAERRRAARAAVREAAAVTAPVNGKRPETAEQPVAAGVEG